jgi:hypothetical protein
MNVGMPSRKDLSTSLNFTFGVGNGPSFVKQQTRADKWRTSGAKKKAETCG